MPELNENQVYNRVVRLTGNAAFQRLRQSRVAVFGLGGVGSWCVEALARTGIGRLTLIDADVVAASNINRQLPALQTTVGQSKVDVLRRRIAEIDPTIEVEVREMRYSPETAAELPLEGYDYVVDAIDSVSDKAHLILTACRARVPLVSSMGAALRIDPTRVKVATDFQKVTGDALAAALRRRFRKLDEMPRRKFACVWSDEPRRVNVVDCYEDLSGAMSFNKVVVNGALCQVTAAFGMALASVVINKLAGLK